METKKKETVYFQKTGYTGMENIIINCNMKEFGQTARRQGKNDHRNDTNTNS